MLVRVLSTRGPIMFDVDEARPELVNWYSTLPDGEHEHLVCEHFALHIPPGFGLPEYHLIGIAEACSRDLQ